ncbi:MAG TPA: polysaccharide deacetylase family protein [Terriglobales bacterium]
MIKEFLKRALIGSGAMRFAARAAGKGAAIVMYHSVQDDPAASLDQLGGIVHSARVFRGQMEIVARHFAPVTMDQILRFVRGGGDLPPRAVVVTFDDGYSDNYHVARAILDSVGIPAVFYVAVDCVDRQTLPWPSLLRHMFLTGTAPSWKEPGGSTWPLSTREQRLDAFEQASKHCARRSGEAQKAFLQKMESELHAMPLVSKSPMMTWDEIRALDRGGHSIGSHTLTHPNMAQVSPADAEVEFKESKRRLEDELAKPVPHFSYPCPALQPHWADHTVNLSREIGYLTGVTTNGGMVRQSDEPLKLRRIRPTKTIHGLHWNLERTFCGAVV